MFITFEGQDGSGKSTQIQLLREYLLEEGRQVVLTREPGGPALSEKIRTLLLDPQSDMQAETEALLCAAARAEHAARVIRPALEGGKVVLCDRYYDSSIAYQGYGRGLPLDWLRAVNEMALQIARPDRTYLLLLSGASVRERKGEGLDRIERETDEFFARVREGYLRIAEGDRARVRSIDAGLPIAQIARRIRGDAARLLGLPADGERC